MKETPARPLPHIGLRNLKTALSASLCALIYFFLNRNPAFACIGAIFGMGADMDHSKLHGGNRLFGTVIGGFLGIGLYRIYLVFYPDGGRHLLLVPLLFGGIVVLILLAQIFWVGAVQPGGVVLCLLLFSIGPDDYISYSLNRMLDTGVGVAMSLLINGLLPPGAAGRLAGKARRPAEPERGGPLRAAAPTKPAPSGHSTRTAGPPPPGPRRG